MVFVWSFAVRFAGRQRTDGPHTDRLLRISGEHHEKDRSGTVARLDMARGLTFEVRRKLQLAAICRFDRGVRHQRDHGSRAHAKPLNPKLVIFLSFVSYRALKWQLPPSNTWIHSVFS